MNDLSELKFYKNNHCLEIKKVLLTKNDIKYFYHAGRPFQILIETYHNENENFFVIFFTQYNYFKNNFIDLNILDLFKWLKNRDSYNCYSISKTNINNLINKEVYVISDLTINTFIKYFKE